MEPENIRQQLLEVVDLLQEELEREVPNKTLLHVFTAYLETVAELRPYVRQLVLLMEAR